MVKHGSRRDLQKKTHHRQAAVTSAKKKQSIVIIARQHAGEVVPLETGLPAARDAPSGTSGPKPAGPAKFIAAPASKSHYLPLAAAKKPSSRGIDKPRTKLSRRMAGTLSFFADNNSIRSKPAVAETKRCRSASAVRKTTSAPAAQTLSVNELLADLHKSTGVHHMDGMQYASKVRKDMGETE